MADNTNEKVASRPVETLLRSTSMLLRGMLLCRQICFVGRNVRIAQGVRIRPMTFIEDDVIIGPDTFIGVGVLIRKGSNIGARCTIGHYCVLEGNLFIDNDTHIHAQCHLGQGTYIEQKVFMGPMCMTINTKRVYLYRNFTSPIEVQHIKKGARIGGGVHICPGVTIGVEASVGAGTLVVRDVPDYAIFYGNPGKPQGMVPFDELIFKTSFTKGGFCLWKNML